MNDPERGSSPPECDRGRGPVCDGHRPLDSRSDRSSDRMSFHWSVAPLRGDSGGGARNPIDDELRTAWRVGGRPRPSPDLTEAPRPPGGASARSVTLLCRVQNGSYPFLSTARRAASSPASVLTKFGAHRYRCLLHQTMCGTAAPRSSSGRDQVEVRYEGASVVRRYGGADTRVANHQTVPTAEARDWNEAAVDRDRGRSTEDRAVVRASRERARAQVVAFIAFPPY